MDMIVVMVSVWLTRVLVAQGITHPKFFIGDGVQDAFCYECPQGAIDGNPIYTWAQPML
jgi:hypothetical protein